ncbi:hypothetical protein RI054_04g24140 [Pseudoscourfieldia marina]
MEEADCVAVRALVGRTIAVPAMWWGAQCARRGGCDEVTHAAHQRVRRDPEALGCLHRVTDEHDADGVEDEEYFILSLLSNMAACNLANLDVITKVPSACSTLTLQAFVRACSERERDAAEPSHTMWVSRLGVLRNVASAVKRRFRCLKTCVLFK